MKASETKKSCVPTTKEAQNNAFAGTGNPTKEIVWRVSLLNFASRNAENMDNKNAKYGNQVATQPIPAG